jgi:glycine hydroxymethyltransferase
MTEIADLIALTLNQYEGAKDEILARVAALTGKYPLYPGY